MKRYFIIGTDTDCGKTYVTCQLVDYFKTQGFRSMAIKPVFTGMNVDESNKALQLYNGNSLEITHCSFRDPISPHLAAEAEGQCISVQEVVDFCFSPVFADHDYLFIESAGGLMAPLNRKATWIEVLIKSQIPVILVVGMRLGCLNHAQLTAFLLHHYKINCVGWLANCIDEKMLALHENIATLKEKFTMPLLATLSYKSKISDRIESTL